MIDITFITNQDVIHNLRELYIKLNDTEIGPGSGTTTIHLYALKILVESATRKNVKQRIAALKEAAK